ncbi:MAG: hypothetical protein IKZ91_01490 [Bacteroidales bacterium]|nr:hypothetical protein [Bacteroidales bacterium]
MKVNRIILLSAIALTGLISCQREPVNPNFDASTNEVVTSLVLNFDTNSNTQTKMSGDATQAELNSTFRGITDAQLMAIIKEDHNGEILDKDQDAAKVYNLATVLSPSSITSSNSRRVLEMSLPLKTNTLLFYGRAPQGTADVTGMTAKDCNGYLDTLVISGTADKTRFGYGVRLAAGSDDYLRFRAVEKLFGGLLSCLLNLSVPTAVNLTADASPAPVTSGTTVKPYGFDVTVPAGLFWADYANANKTSPITPADDLHPLELKLANLYKQMTSINTADGELRAASGDALCLTIQDLWSVINGIRCAEPTCPEEAVAKYVAERIYINISNVFNGTQNDNGLPVTGVVFKSPSAVIAALNGVPNSIRPTPSDAEWPSASELALITDSENLNTFPASYGLPRGAAYIGFDSGKKLFYYPQNFNTNAMGTPISGSGIYGPMSYYYPAELLYFGNSPISTCDTDKAVDDYPNGNGNGTGQWFNTGSWPAAEWSKNYVAASTRAVAMRNSINYGVALLNTKVQYSTLSLKDNNHAIQKALNPSINDNEEPNQTITVNNATDFQLTGVIIGQQNRFVGWDFLPTVNQTTNVAESGFVYDRAIPEASRNIPATANTPSAPNYTLLFDNFNGTAAGGYWTPSADQQVVSVALEFYNNSGKDFYGLHNVIRNGGYFYLIGQLDPANGGTITWPTTHVIPPYKADLTQDNTKRVFMQDFTTNVTFTLGEYSLQYAYLTVPDLRSSSLTLGLSVDIKWETGCVFDNVPLGGTTDHGAPANP